MEHNPTTSNTHVSCGNGTGSFTAEITGLVVETTYYVRAYAVNASGTAYGEEVSFVTVNPGGVPEGALPGVFNAGQRFVYFSQGNLQYQASSNTWRFAEHQYDRCDGNQYASSYYNGWIDCFAWGTSGYNHGAVHYEPWTIVSTSNYNDFFAYGDPNANLNDQTGQADWGYNAISNGGNTTNIWNTLTADEWEYIINARYTPTNSRFAKARVNEVAGLILLPDNWETSIYSLNNINIGNTSFDANKINASDWTILEEAGAVFLPGYIAYNGYGEYWASTAWYQTNYVPTAYTVAFSYNIGSSENCYVKPKYKDYRYSRHFVRLVQTVNR